jgi:AraC family transcriptional regulator
MPNPTEAVDLRKAALAPILPRTPLLSSVQSEWQGIALEYFRYPPFETPEYAYPEHKIAIHTHIPEDLQVERRLDGRFQSDRVVEKQVIVVPAHVTHQVQWDRASEFLILSVTPALLSQVADGSIVDLVPRLPQPDPLIHQIGLTLKQELEDGGGDRLYVESLINCLTVHLLTKYSNVKRSSSSDTSQLSPSRLKLAIEYIHDNLGKNISLTDLAGIANLSLSQFSRLFRQETGLSPHQYSLHARIEQAKHLLRSSRDISISNIAHQLGFADQSHFTRHFKRIVGVTPKVLLQANSRNVLNFSTNVQDLET